MRGLARSRRCFDPTVPRVGQCTRGPFWPRYYWVTFCRHARTWSWQARNPAVPSIDNNPMRAGFRASSAGVAAHSLKRFSPHRDEWQFCQHQSKDVRAHEKAAPKRSQNRGQSALPAHKNRRLSLFQHRRSRYGLQKPGPANMHRKPLDCSSV
jgi:hypothetical protein